MSDTNTGKTVQYTYDQASPPRLTADEKQRLDSMKDEEIDCSDVPEQTGLATWSRPGLFGGPVGKLRQEALKEKLLLLDEDVLDFFKKSGQHSADRINAVLRNYVKAQRKSA